MFLSVEFDILTIFILTLITISQSLFGVGILLWGTPLFLLLGQSFTDTLSLLLPLSFLISILQVLPELENVDRRIFIRFLSFSFPGIFLGLNFTLIYKPDVNIIVASILFISIGLNFRTLSYVILKFVKKYDPAFIFIIGLVHGISNLGGPLILLRISFEKFKKESYRALTASVYLLFSTIQMAIIVYQFGYLKVSLIYIILVVGVYLITNKFIFLKLTQTVFDRLVSILMLLMAVFLILRA